MTYHMYGFTRWKRGGRIGDAMLQAIARVLNHNKQAHKFQPKAFALLSDADIAVMSVALFLDLWLGTNPEARTAANLREFVVHQIESACELDDLNWLPDLCERVFPLLEFPKEIA